MKYAFIRAQRGNHALSVLCSVLGVSTSGRMAKSDLEEIRDATNKSGVLGSERFRKDFECRTQRTAVPRARGGDRRSKERCGS